MLQAKFDYIGMMTIHAAYVVLRQNFATMHSWCLSKLAFILASTLSMSSQYWSVSPCSLIVHVGNYHALRSRVAFPLALTTWLLALTTWPLLTSTPSSCIQVSMSLVHPCVYHVDQSWLHLAWAFQVMVCFYQQIGNHQGYTTLSTKDLLVIIYF